MYKMLLIRVILIWMMCESSKSIINSEFKSKLKYSLIPSKFKYKDCNKMLEGIQSIASNEEIAHNDYLQIILEKSVNCTPRESVLLKLANSKVIRLHFVGAINLPRFPNFQTLKRLDLDGISSLGDNASNHTDSPLSELSIINYVGDNLDLLKIAHLKKLVYLDLTNNNIVNLDNLYTYESLHTLILNRNKIDSLPQLHLANLQELCLDNNKFQDFNLDMSNLKRLSVVDNKINILELCKQLACELEFVNISGNILTSLGNNVFKNANKLKYIDLSNNNIATIDSSFAHTSLLVHLNLDNNYLKSIPGKLAASLAYLNVDNNKIDSLKYGEPLLKLKHFSSANNGIKEFQFFKNRQTKLHNLIVRSNSLELLEGPMLGNCQTMKHIDFSRNSISKIKKLTFAKCIVLRTLFLNQNFLKSFNRNIFGEFITIHLLKIYNNDIACNCNISWLLNFSEVKASIYLPTSFNGCKANTSLGDLMKDKGCLIKKSGNSRSNSPPNDKEIEVDKSDFSITQIIILVVVVIESIVIIVYTYRKKVQREATTGINDVAFTNPLANPLGSFESDSSIKAQAAIMQCLTGMVDDIVKVDQEML